MVSPHQHRDAIGITSRRDVLKAAIGGTGVAALSKVLPHVRAATAPESWQRTREYQTITDKLLTQSSCLELNSTELTSTYWDHLFYLDGHAVTTNLDGDTKEVDIFSQSMQVDEQDSCLGTFVGVDDQTNAMYPQPDESNEEEWFELLTTALETAADVLGRTVAATVLTATDLVQALLNAFTNVDGTMPVTWTGVYNDVGGVAEVNHHLGFHIHEQGTCSDFSDSMSVFSETGALRTVWDIGFSEGSVTASASPLPSMRDGRLEWGHPESMTEAEKAHFGVHRITRDHVAPIRMNEHPNERQFLVQVDGAPRKVTRNLVQHVKDTGPAYIATDPPVEVDARTEVVEDRGRP